MPAKTIFIGSLIIFNHWLPYFPFTLTMQLYSSFHLEACREVWNDRVKKLKIWLVKNDLPCLTWQIILRLKYVLLMCKSVKICWSNLHQLVHFSMKYGSNNFALVSTKIINHPDFLLPGRSFFEAKYVRPDEYSMSWINSCMTWIKKWQKIKEIVRMPDS